MNRKSAAALACAVAGGILGSASVSKAFTDTFTDNNPLTINNNPTYTVQSYGEGTFAPTDPANPNTLTAGPDVIAESGGTLNLGITQPNDIFNGHNNAPIIQTALTSDLNFWQHPVEVDITAPVGGNLMPTNETVQNGVFFDIGIMSKPNQRVDTGDARMYFQLSNPWGNNVTTSYQIRTNGNTSTYVNASPTFNQTIPATSRITKIMLTFDGTGYNRATDTGTLFFNWGADITLADGTQKEYWYGNSSGASPYYTGFGPRMDVNYGSGGFALGKDIAPLYDSWFSGGANPADGLSGDSSLTLELLRGGTTATTPTSVTIAGITAGDPTAVIALPGDITGPGGGGPDGIVDQNDLNVILQHFGQAANAANGDISGPAGTSDGIVDQNDLNVVLQNFGHTAGGAGLEGGLSASLAAVAVPEPTSMGLLLLGGSLAMAKRRRKA